MPRRRVALEPMDPELEWDHWHLCDRRNCLRDDDGQRKRIARRARASHSKPEVVVTGSPGISFCTDDADEVHFVVRTAVCKETRLLSCNSFTASAGHVREVFDTLMETGKSFLFRSDSDRDQSPHHSFASTMHDHADMNSDDTCHYAPVVSEDLFFSNPAIPLSNSFSANTPNREQHSQSR